MACCTALAVAGACGDDEDDGPGGVAGTTATGQGAAAQGGGGSGGAAQGGGGLAAGPCAQNVCVDAEPDTACETFIGTECTAELAACMADLGEGGGGGASCIGCAEFIGEGEWEDTCDSSKLVFASLLECACGDATQPGACN